MITPRLSRIRVFQPRSCKFLLLVWSSDQTLVRSILTESEHFPARLPGLRLAWWDGTLTLVVR